MQKKTYSIIHEIGEGGFAQGDENVKAQNKTRCPYLQDPLDACYCNHMDSQNIEKTVYYCNFNFKACEIYNYRIQGAADKAEGE